MIITNHKIYIVNYQEFILQPNLDVGLDTHTYAIERDQHNVGVIVFKIFNATKCLMLNIGEVVYPNYDLIVSYEIHCCTIKVLNLQISDE